MIFGLVGDNGLLAIAHLACCAVAGAAVALRIFCKVRYKQGIRVDDWSIIGALLVYYVAVLGVVHRKSSNLSTTKTY